MEIFIQQNKNFNLFQKLKIVTRNFLYKIRKESLYLTHFLLIISLRLKRIKKCKMQKMLIQGSRLYLTSSFVLTADNFVEITGNDFSLITDDDNSRAN